MGSKSPSSYKRSRKEALIHTILNEYVLCALHWVKHFMYFFSLNHHSSSSLLISNLVGRKSRLRKVHYLAQSYTVVCSQTRIYNQICPASVILPKTKTKQNPTHAHPKSFTISVKVSIRQPYFKRPMTKIVKISSLYLRTHNFSSRKSHTHFEPDLELIRGMCHQRS